MIKDVVKVKA
jgi:site-specific recombinase XerD